MQGVALHVIPAGDAWAVENDCGTMIARESGRIRAVEHAREICLGEGVPKIIVHWRNGALDVIPMPARKLRERKMPPAAP